MVGLIQLRTHCALQLQQPSEWCTWLHFPLLLLVPLQPSRSSEIFSKRRCCKSAGKQHLAGLPATASHWVSRLQKPGNLVFWWGKCFPPWPSSRYLLTWVWADPGAVNVALGRCGLPALSRAIPNAYACHRLLNITLLNKSYLDPNFFFHWGLVRVIFKNNFIDWKYIGNYFWKPSYFKWIQLEIIFMQWRGQQTWWCTKWVMLGKVYLNKKAGKVSRQTIYQ